MKKKTIINWLIVLSMLLALIEGKGFQNTTTGYFWLFVFVIFVVVNLTTPNKILNEEY